MINFSPTQQMNMAVSSATEPLLYDPQAGNLDHWLMSDTICKEPFDELLTALHVWQEDDAIFHSDDSSSCDSESQSTGGPDIIESSRKNQPPRQHSLNYMEPSKIISKFITNTYPSPTKRQSMVQQQVSQRIGASGIGPHDVLLGRVGRSLLQLPGNTKYCKLIDANMSLYHDAPKFRKQEIADHVIQEIHKCGGAFLQYDNDVQEWVEIDDDSILIKKVSHAFRNRLRLPNKRRNSFSKKEIVDKIQSV